MKHPETHPDEGQIHAWLDDALDEREAREIEAHVASCAACAAMVAEARGLIAASSRIVSLLDGVPAQVVPQTMPSEAPHLVRRTPTVRTRAWWRQPAVAAAALFFVTTATWVGTRESRAPRAGMSAPMLSSQAIEQAPDAPASAAASARVSAPVSAPVVAATPRIAATANEARSAARGRVDTRAVAARGVASAPMADSAVDAPVRPAPSAMSVTALEAKAGASRNESAVSALPALAGCYAIAPLDDSTAVGGGASAAFAPPPRTIASRANLVATLRLLHLTDTVAPRPVVTRSAERVDEAAVRERTVTTFLGAASGSGLRTAVRWSRIGDGLLRVELPDGTSLLARIVAEGTVTPTAPRADLLARRVTCPR